MYVQVALAVFLVCYIMAFGYWFGRQDENKIFHLSPNLNGICCFVMSLSALYLALNSYCFPIESINWPSTEGKVIDCVDHTRNGFGLIGYSYKVNNKEYKNSFDLITLDSSIKADDKIKVHYKEGDPKISGLEMGLGSKFTIGSLVLVGTILTFFGMHVIKEQETFSASNVEFKTLRR